LLISAFAPVIGVLGGWYAGWLADWWFHETIYQTLQAFHVNTALFTLPQLGATLGFFTGFLVRVRGGYYVPKEAVKVK
jgi:hypothetical protein